MVINAVDVVYLINYVYKNIDARAEILTCPGNDGDWNCNGLVDAVNVVYCINYAYKNTGSPCDPFACEPYPTSCP